MTKFALEFELAEVDVIVRALTHWRTIQDWAFNSKMASDGERNLARNDIEIINKLLKDREEVTDADIPRDNDDGLRGAGGH